MTGPARSITTAMKATARAAATAFGGGPKVVRYYDEPEQHSLDILTCEDRPAPGFSSFSTVGLHAARNLLDGDDIRVELCGVAPLEATAFANVLATAGFCVMKDRWLCAPGVVFPNLLRDSGLGAGLPHVMFIEPFPWEELGDVEVEPDLMVHWLLALPISEAERRLLLDQGYHVLEQRFVDHEIEYFDLERPSVA